MTATADRQPGTGRIVHHFTREVEFCPEMKARQNAAGKPSPPECDAMTRAVKEAFKVRGW
jgi:hypothetical protein